MRNHFHLALETPEPNLVDGMHWLQSTYATRLNRFRRESGHLFQGRYQSLLVEDAAALVRVVDYIHLNPVRAKIVPVEQVTAFRWSSLARWTRKEAPKWLVAAKWLEELGFDDSSEGWECYQRRLVERATVEDPKREDEELCSGWAIGTSGWRRAVAKDHQHLALNPGIAAQEVRDLKHARWEKALEAALQDTGRTEAMLQNSPRSAGWICDLALRLRREVGASPVWLADHLNMGSPDSMRSLLSRHISRNQQISARPL